MNSRSEEKETKGFTSTRYRPHSLGVVLVHGIGNQAKGETLIRWGDALVDTLNRIAPNHVTATIKQANLGHASRRDPAHAEVHIHSKGRPEYWLLTEAWWAEAFSAPSYGQLVSWSLKAVPFAITTHIYRRHVRRFSRVNKEGTGKAKKLVFGVLAGLEVSLALLLTPVILTILVALLAVGLIPIPKVRSYVGIVQRALAVTFGDSLALLESPIRSAAIQRQVLDALDWTSDQDCTHLAVLAHSQGAAVAMLALGGLGPTTGERKNDKTRKGRGDVTVPDALISFGAGINKLAALMNLRDCTRGKPASDSSDSYGLSGLAPLWIATLALFASSAFGAGLWLQVVSGTIDMLDLVALPIVIVVISLVGWAFEVVMRLLLRRKPDWKAFAKKVYMGIFVSLTLAISIAAVVYKETTDKNIYGGLYFVILLMILFVALRYLLSPDFHPDVSHRINKPEGVKQWNDFFASADPVPNGKTRSAQPDVPESIEIWNAGSLVGDHTLYWKNVDGFVVPMIRALAKTAESPLEQELPPPETYDPRQAKWRVDWLRFARWAILSAWFAFGVVHWQGVARAWPAVRIWLSKTLGRADTSTEQGALLGVVFAVAVVGLTAWLGYAFARWAWWRWITAEYNAALRHRSPRGLPLRFWIFASVSIVVFSAGWVSTDLWTISEGWGDLLATIVGILVFGLGIVWVATRFWPPPDSHAALQHE